MNVPPIFGEWLRQRRHELGLTRKELAGRVGCSVSMLRKIENGERRPSGQIAKLIANCLDIPAADHTTFVRVARGELRMERLIRPSDLIPRSNVPLSKSKLPIMPTPLIGRQYEVEKLGGLLRDSQCRLLTLIGPGGIGKTRLAIETALRLQDSFTDGVYFVPLAPVNSLRYVVPVIADAVGYAFQSARSADPKRQLFSFLEEKQVLFLIDNLEHLLTEPGIEVLSELLASAPQIKLLTTSRESLRLQGEWIFELHGLPVPESGPTEGTSMELFLQHARRVRSEFSAAPEDLSAMLRVCQLVDGMPLAIELAATWMRTLACDEIADEIERGLDFLSASTRDLPPRHRSMRAVFDHSWKLLAEAEQRVLARLSVFRGGFQREAAEQVAGATLPILSSLVTKSLIRKSGDRRFDMHALIRQYALDRLGDELNAQEEARRLHAHYYLEYFGRADGRLRSLMQVETLAVLTAEMANFRAAWDWAIVNREFAYMYQAAMTLWYLFELRTWFEEGKLIFGKAAESLQSYLKEIGGDAELSEIANALRGHSAFFMFRLGNTLAAYDALTIVKEQLAASASMYVQMYLGIVCRDLGRSREADEAFRDSLESAEAYGDRWLQSMAGQFLGVSAFERGNYASAHHYLMEALEVGREIGDPMLIAHALSFVSLAVQAVGEATNAEEFLKESLALAQKIGYRWGVGNALDGLGVLAQETNPHEARRLLAAGSDIYREIGDLRSLARALCHQGYNSLSLDDIPSAHESFMEALVLARKCDYATCALDALVGIAGLHAKRDNAEDALALLLCVLNHPDSIQKTKIRASRLLADLEAQLPPQEIEALRQSAETRTFAVLVNDMLGQH